MWVAASYDERALIFASRICELDDRHFFSSVLLGLSNRELLVYKNCTSNCTFLYKAETPPEAPRMVTTNNFYWVRCCNSMTCNEGGPTLERDILTEETVEEEIEGAVRFGESTSFLIFVSTLVSSVLT